MQYSILVITAFDNWHLNAPDFPNELAIFYNKWSEVANENGARLLRACIDWFEDGRFIKYWEHTPEGWLKREEPICPDIIYDKCSNSTPDKQWTNYLIKQQKDKIDKHIKIQNTPMFTSLVGNKVYQAVLFNKSLPSSTYYGEKVTLSNPNKTPWVIKGPFGAGGKTVRITTDEEIEVDHEIVQTFSQVSEAQESIQDVRLVFLGEKLLFASSRTAPEGSWYTNIHHGATFHILDPAQVSHIIEEAKIITRPLREVFPQQLYSMDFLANSDLSQYQLIEMNSMPGINPLDEEATQATNIDNSPSYLNAYTDEKERLMRDILQEIVSWLLNSAKT